MARPDGFGVKVEDDIAVFEVTIPAKDHQTRLTVSVVIPDAYWGDTLTHWAPAHN